MTKKIFWIDPYKDEWTTYVETVSGPELTLKETIFFAFSGGQESDRGSIGGFEVIDARKDGKNIIYTLPEKHSLSAKDLVIVKIDWDRRYRLMRLHFAAELVLELVCKHFPSVVKIGAHIAQEKARIDFAWDQNVSAHLAFLTQELQHIVVSDEEITSAFSDEQNEIRYWQIPNFAQVPCGGTHIRRTGELGSISLKRANPGKGKERIEIYLEDVR